MEVAHRSSSMDSDMFAQFAASPSCSPPSSPPLSARSTASSSPRSGRASRSPSVGAGGNGSPPGALSPRGNPSRVSLDLTTSAEGRLALSPRVASTSGSSKKARRFSRKNSLRGSGDGSLRSSALSGGHSGDSNVVSDDESSEVVSFSTPHVTISPASGGGVGGGNSGGSNGTRAAVAYVLPAPLMEKVVQGILDAEDPRAHDMLLKLARTEYKAIAKASRLPRTWAEKLATFPSATTYFAYSKNRYPKDVLATESTRVKLLDTEHDYINANYLMGHRLPGGADVSYIACQAPLPSTMDDFWLMVWQQRSCVVVMLTKFREKGLVKAHPYWPKDANCEPMQFGAVSVTLLTQKVIPGIAISTLRVVNHHVVVGGAPASRTIYHLWYTDWPDFGVPKSTLVLRSLISYTNLYAELGAQQQDARGPIVCHCSAGLGRTGTMIGVHIGMSLLESGVRPDVVSLVTEMRRARAGMVQTDAQYVFIYEALNDHIRQYQAAKKPRRNASRRKRTATETDPTALGGSRSFYRPVRHKPVEPETPVAIDEDDVAFVQQLTGSQLKLFTEHLDDPAIRKSALDEAREQGLVEDKRSKKRKPLRPAPRSDDVQEYERAPREQPAEWVEQQIVQDLLPVRQPDGSVAAPKLTPEQLAERKAMLEKRVQREADAAAQPKAQRRRLQKGGAVVEVTAVKTAKEQLREAAAAMQDDDEEGSSSSSDNDDAGPTEAAELREYQARLEKTGNKKEQIRTLSTELLANPEACIVKNASALYWMCLDPDLVIKQLALLSLAAVFSDLMPAYRVRDEGDEPDSTIKVQLSKEVRRVRRFERHFLQHYRKYIDLLHGILTLKKPNPAGEQPDEHPTFRVNSSKALAQLQLVSIKAMSRVLLSNPSFNFAEDIIDQVVKFANRPDMADGAIAKVAVESIEGLFAKENELEMILLAVQKVGELIKQKRNEAHPPLLQAFLHLVIGEGVSDIDIKTEAERGVRKKDRVHLSRKQKKQRKLDKEVEAAVREADAGRVKSDLQKFQRSMAQSMFLTYFRILKNHAPTGLLPAALEGIARWCHLINVEFMFDIVQTLLQLLQRSNLALAPALHCAITAFQALRNAGDVFRIDLTAYYVYVYPRLMKLPFEPGPESSVAEGVYSVTIRCLQLMLASKTYRMSARSAAFAKRLATIALQSVPAGCIGLMQLCRQVIGADPRLEQLVDPEDLGFGSTYSPDVDDPDHCNPFSTALFELHLLQEHYHPHVRLFADTMLKGGEPAPHDPSDYLFSYGMATQIFNPPLAEPGPDRYERKYRKLQKYSASKRRGFLPSLMPPMPETESDFLRDSVALFEESFASERL